MGPGTPKTNSHDASLWLAVAAANSNHPTDGETFESGILDTRAVGIRCERLAAETSAARAVHEVPYSAGGSLASHTPERSPSLTP